MISFSLSRRSLRAAALAVAIGWLVAEGSGLRAAGFTEPPAIFFGQVNQTYNGYTVPVTQGTLTWTIRPSGTAAPVVIRQVVGALSGASFYRLEVPVEKVPTSAYTLSLNTIPTATASYDRSLVSLDGSPVSIVYPATTDRGTLTFAETSRGKLERLDLSLTTAFLDSDGDGLPDWFEDKYGRNKYDPSDATAPDPYGRSWLDDYNNHVSPTTAPLSEYGQWTVSNTLVGTAADPLADSDVDGVPNVVEFALGTNPKVSDLAAVAQRSLVQLEATGGRRYLTMTVQKAGRTTANYVVEASSDLRNWSSVEGTAVRTLVNTSATLKVQSVGSPDVTPAAPIYLRLRVTLTTP